MNPSDYLTTRQAAELAGVSLSLIQKSIRRGEIPARRIGRDNLVTAADVTVWKDTPRQRPGRPKDIKPDCL
jgi:excisionase family DNA binding protein